MIIPNTSNHVFNLDDEAELLLPSDVQMSLRLLSVHVCSSGFPRTHKCEGMLQRRHKKLIIWVRVEWGGLYATSQGSRQIETSVAEYGKRAHSKGCWEFLIGC